MTTRVAIAGVTGRMGSLISRIIDESDDFELVAGIGTGGSLDELTAADVVVDVTQPSASPEIVEFAVAHGMNVIVGTSGWSADRVAKLEKKIAGNLAVGVLIVPNFSLGSVLATVFAATAARYFDSIEIVESHHSGKVDSPSGTAVRTAEVIASARGDLGPVAATHADQRARGQLVAGVPVHSLRMRGVVAQQEVIFGGNGEQLTIVHDTVSPSAYEAGILRALRAIGDVRGVLVGLDKVIELDLGQR